MPRGPAAVPTALVTLVDDAAIFPPGNASVADAVAAHADHRRAWYADLVGPFVISDRLLPELSELLRHQQRSAPMPVTVVVGGGAGAIEPALTWVARAPGLRLRSVEVAARDDDGTPGGLAHNVTRITTALTAIDQPVPAHVELPRLRAPTPTADWLRGLDVLATSGAAVKFRTGGEGPEDHPAASELVAGIDAALDREVSFKCTAGLHHAVRHTSPEGWQQHGFLNVLVATAALLDAAGHRAATELLADRDPAPLLAALSGWPTDATPPARRWFTSFGSCSIADPVDDLVRLGLLVPQ